MDSEHRVAVITGASAGVGRATARLFAEKGWDLGLIARGRDGLEAARKEAEGFGVRAVAIAADVADADAVEEAARAIEATLGPIRCWINNAMVGVMSPVKELRADEIRRVTEVTYLGSVYGTLSALRRMLPRDEGVIVEVGSALAYRSIPLQAAYCGAKHATLGFVEALRCELLHDRSRVRVSMVQLPALNTPQFGWIRSRFSKQPQPVPPIYQPEVAAKAILWAAEHPCRELNVGYRTSAAILLGHLFPSLVDHYLARTGYRSQFTDEPMPRGRRDNLFEPLPGDHGAHGRFDDRSHRSSVHLWYEKHRVGALAGLAAGAGLATWARSQRSKAGFGPRTTSRSGAAEPSRGGRRRTRAPSPRP